MPKASTRGDLQLISRPLHQKERELETSHAADRLTHCVWRSIRFNPINMTSYRFTRTAQRTECMTISHKISLKSELSISLRDRNSHCGSMWVIFIWLLLQDYLLQALNGGMMFSFRNIFVPLQNLSMSYNFVQVIPCKKQQQQQKAEQVKTIQQQNNQLLPTLNSTPPPLTLSKEIMQNTQNPSDAFSQNGCQNA